MKEICLDEGTIQAFLDGELADAQMDAATRHIALCDNCALLLSAAEEESAFAFSALDGDLNTLVPTQRLWSKINDSIVEEKRKGSFWFNFSSFVSNLSRPSIAAFASLLIVTGLFVGLMVLRPTIPNDGVVTIPENNAGVIEVIEMAKTNPPSISNVEDKTPSLNAADKSISEPAPVVIRTTQRPDRNEEFSATRADYRPKSSNSNPSIKEPKKPEITAPQFLPGEETYIRTISNLSETVNSQKDTAMKPSARFAYEKDLAVINDAIDKMKSEVKKNPKNEAAKDILFASYQNKINLLNSVTERTELLASIR